MRRPPGHACAAVAVCLLQKASCRHGISRRPPYLPSDGCLTFLKKRHSVDNNKKSDDTVGEEISAFGQRVKGAAKDAVGDVVDDRGLEREGERENAMGRARQASNNVMDETDGVRGATVSGASRDRYVTGLYPTAEAASRAYSGLTTEHGYKAEDINVVMSDETRKRHFGDVTPGRELSGGTKAAEGLGKGSAIGGGIG